MVDLANIPGTPAYHAEWTARKAAADQAAAEEAAAARLAAAPPPPVDYQERSGPMFATDLSGQPVSGSRIAQPGDLQGAALASLDARGLPRPPSMSDAQRIAAAEGTAADEYERAGLTQLGMQGAQTVSSVANPNYGLTKKYVDTSRRITDQMPGAHQAVDDAEMVRAVKVADFMEEQANRQSEAISDMQARQFAQEEQAFEAQERSKKAYALVDQTTKRMADAPAVDPNRWWSSRSDGQKFGAVLGMLGRGVHMGDPLGAIMPMIDRDIEAQKATFAQMQAASGAAANQANISRGLYADIRAQTQDEREADEIMRIARLEQAKQQFEAMAAQTAIPSIKAAQDVTRLAFDQSIADRRMQLDKIAAHNVKRKTVVSKAYQMVQLPNGQVVRVPVGGPGQMAAAKYALEQADKSRGDARKILGEETIEGVKAGNKAREDAEKGSLEERKFQYQQRKDQAGGEKGAAVETALGLGRDYLADYGENVPGRTEGGIGGEAWLSEPGWWQSDEGLRESKRRETLSMWYATALTGANVSKKQEEFLDRLATDTSMSGNEIRAGVEDLNRSLEIYQSTYQRGAEEAAQADYRGVAPEQLPQRDPKTGGRTRSNTSDADQAAALGGKLR
jgi:hypothetical protein